MKTQIRRLSYECASGVPRGLIKAPFGFTCLNIYTNKYPNKRKLSESQYKHNTQEERMCTGDRLKVMLVSMTPRKTSVPLMMGNPSNYALRFTILLNLTHPGPSTYSAHLLSRLILHFFICSAWYKLPAYQNNLLCLDCNFHKTGLINYFSLCLLQSSSVSKIKLV